MDTDKTMTTVFQKLISASYKLFSRQNGCPITNDSLSELKQYINQVTKSELRLEPIVERPISGDEAPVTYMKIIDDQVMTVAVFVLRKGKRLPLHDHPRMYGLLKVVHGEVKIKTYSPLDKVQYPVPKSVKDDLYKEHQRPIGIYPVRYEGLRTFSESDECAVITPDGHSIHEIYAESGNAAFLDVLAPPYNHHDRTNQNYRPCNYYMELRKNEDDHNLRYLGRINAPRDYWCDEAEYCGPKLPMPP